MKIFLIIAGIVFSIVFLFVIFAICKASADYDKLEREFWENFPK
jgi:hypothetical protein